MHEVGKVQKKTALIQLFCEWQHTSVIIHTGSFFFAFFLNTSSERERIHLKKRKWRRRRRILVAVD
jgi:hypothetical protein